LLPESVELEDGEAAEASEEAGVAGVDGLSSTEVLELRLSVTYQPLPLNTTRGAVSTRFAVPLPHSSQVWLVSASKPWRSS